MKLSARAGRVAVGVALLGCVAMPRTAAALEHQHQIGVGPQIAMLVIDGKSTVDLGAGAAAHYTYGLNDQLTLMAEASWALVAANQQQDTPTTPHNRPADVEHAAFGVGYVIDVIRWVPYLGVLAAGYRLGGGTLDNAIFIPGVEAGLGLDYELSRNWAVGVAFRQHFLLTKLSTYPSYTTGELRIQYMWGY